MTKWLRSSRARIVFKQNVTSIERLNSSLRRQLNSCFTFGIFCYKIKLFALLLHLGLFDLDTATYVTKFANKESINHEMAASDDLEISRTVYMQHLETLWFCISNLWTLPKKKKQVRTYFKVKPFLFAFSECYHHQRKSKFTVIKCPSYREYFITTAGAYIIPFMSKKCSFKWQLISWKHAGWEVKTGYSGNLKQIICLSMINTGFCMDVHSAKFSLNHYYFVLQQQTSFQYRHYH